MAATIFTSRAVRAGGFLVSEADGFLSRDVITVLAGEVLVAGHVIGKASALGTISAAAKAGGNTGGGNIGTPTIGVGAESGIYQIRCTAAAAGGGTFSVISPTGEALPNATVGTPYAQQIAFTIADGAPDFIVGDAFDVSVNLDLAPWREFNPAHTDGTEVPAGILFDDCDATGGNKRATGVVRSCEVNAAELTWFTGATAAQKTAALADLAGVPQIIARAAI